MKKEKISEVISGIDDKYIEEAATVTKKKKNVLKYVIPAVSVSAAALAVVLIGSSGLFISPDEINTGNEYESTADSNEDGILGKPQQEIVTEPAIWQETVTSPLWIDKTTPEQYPEISDGEIVYYSQNTKISADNVGNQLFSGEMTGYDIYEDKTYTVNGTAFSINKISTECAVAVRTEGDDNFYVYVNTEYSPVTLADMINDLNLRETLSFGKAYSDRYEEKEYRTYISRTYEDFDDSIVWNMLLDDTDIKNISYDRYSAKIIHLSVDIPLLGYKNIHMGVTEDGYVVTNILNTQKCFFIGTDKAEAFGNYVAENVKYTENSTITENPDGTIPGKSDEPQTTPPYDPNSGEVQPETNIDVPYVPTQDMLVEAVTQLSPTA